jgi:penicillin-binding protein 2
MKPLHFRDHTFLYRGLHRADDGTIDFEETLAGSFSSPDFKESRGYLKKRIRLFYIVLVVVFAFLSVRLFQLQLINHEHYYVLAQDNRIRIQYNRAPRGIVYDAQRRPLVHNVPSFNLTIVPFDLPSDEVDREAVVVALASLSSMSEDDIRAFIADLNLISSEPVILQEDTTRDAALIVEGDPGRYPGVVIEHASRREYAFGPLFSHMLGYIGKLSPEEYGVNAEDGYLFSDVIGKNGIELTYESYLRGEHGKRQVEVDSLGRVEHVLATKDPQSGNNLVLSIDLDVQQKVAEFLEKGMRAAGSSKAVAVMIEPSTGNVLAMVDIPSYDNNLFSGGIAADAYRELLEDPHRPLFHQSVSGVYPPGSVIKPVVASAALQEGIVTPQTTIVDTGRISVPNQYNPDIVYDFVGWDLSGLGPMNVYSAIAKSSDIYFYTISGGFKDFEGLGLNRMIEYMTLYQLGARLGIDLPHEAAGLIPTPEWKEAKKGEAWYLGDTYHMSIGQGDVLATPLQVASFTATVANGGTVYQPRVVKQVVDSKGDVVEDLQPVVLRDGFIDDHHMDTIRDAMRQTVLDGSGRALNTLTVTSGGKTGTAQFANNTKTHAWYTAFAPFDDPDIALAVLVDGGGDGDKVAVPIARDIIEWYFTEYRSE